MKTHLVNLLCAVVLSCAAPTAFAQRPELIAQTGHSGPINCVAFSPDGRLVASGGSDSSILLWDVDTGHNLRRFSGQGSEVASIAFSPDGKMIASGNTAGVATLWEVNLGRELFAFKDHASAVLAVAFSPDSKMLASGNDNHIRLWDVSAGKELRAVGAQSQVFSLAFSPDGKIIASGRDDQIVNLWSVESGEALRTLGERARTVEEELQRERLGTDGAVGAVAFSPDGKIIAGGITNSRISERGLGDEKAAVVKLWDVNTGRLLRTLDAQIAPYYEGGQLIHVSPPNGISSVAFTPDGRAIAAATRNSTLKIWNVKTGGIVRTLNQPGEELTCIAYSPRGGGLAAIGTGNAKSVGLWDTGTGKEIIGFGGRIENLTSLALSPDGRSLASGSYGPIRLWDLATNKEVRTLLESYGSDVHVAFSPDGKTVAGTNFPDDRTIKLWDVGASKEPRTLGADDMGSFVAFSPDGKTVVSDGFWDVTTGRKLDTIGGADAASDAPLAFSPDGDIIARVVQITDDEGQREIVKLWSARTGTELRTLDGSYSSVKALAVSPDGKTMAGATYIVDSEFKSLNVVKLWDMATGNKRGVLNGHTDWVESVAFSPDGRTLVSGSRDATVKLWDVETGRELRTLTGHSGMVMSVAFSPDGRGIVSASWDGEINLWEAVSGEVLASLIALDQKDWLVVTPDGLFDGSPAAWNRILWRFSERVFDVAPVEAFFSDFYYPGLLADLFSGRRPKAAQDIAQRDRRQPEVKLMRAGGGRASLRKKTAARNVSVKINVTEAPPDESHPAVGGGARDVRLFRNGSLVKVWRGSVLRNGRGTVILEASVPVVAGENRLTAYAFNRDNVKSADATLRVNGARSLKRAGAIYLIAVGVNKYANAAYNLRYAVADANSFGEELRGEQVKLGRYANVQLVPLLDAAATKANILRALGRLAGLNPPGASNNLAAGLEKLNPAQPEDAVVIYFAGHGAAHANQFYLIPHDLGYEGAGRSLNAAGLAQLLAHSISDRELERAVEKIDAGQLLLVIDACNSGQALEAEEKRRGPMNSKGLAQLAYEKGMYVLTASQSFQAALEASQLGHGLLTYALVEEGLKQTVADKEPKDGQVLVREWFNYATERVPEMQMGQMQRARGMGLNLSFLEEERGLPVERRSGQRPRIFHRRELEDAPFIVAARGR